MEAAAGATDHLVVDGVEVNYLAQGSTTDGVGGVQLNAPMYVQAGNAPQSGTAVTVYSVWGAAAADTIGQAEVRTREEIARLESLGVLFGLPVNSGTDSVCTLDGTSIDNGYKATGMPTSELLNLNFPCTRTDFSENGETEKDMAAGFQDRMGRIYHPLAARNIAYNGGVVNSLIAYGDSPADALADLLAWNAKAHAAGYKTIASTMTSSCTASLNGAVGDTAAQQFNALLLAQADQFDWVANHAAWPQLGATNACAAVGYFSDGLHPNVQGQALEAGDEQAGFEGVYGNLMTSVVGAYTQVPSDRMIVAQGAQTSVVSLMDVNQASFNHAGRLCVQNAGTGLVRVKPLGVETIDGQAIVDVQTGGSLCVRPQVVDATVGGARWTIY